MGNIFNNSKPYDPFSLMTIDMYINPIPNAPDTILIYNEDEPYFTTLSFLESKLLFHKIPLEHYIQTFLSTIKHLPTCTSVPNVFTNKNQSLFISKIEQKDLILFSDELTKPFQDKKSKVAQIQATKEMIKTFGETMTFYIQKRQEFYYLNAFHVIAFGLIYCKGENARKLRFMYELFREVSGAFYVHSYIKETLFCVIMIVTVVNINTQEKLGMICGKEKEKLMEMFGEVYLFNELTDKLEEELFGVEEKEKIIMKWEEMYSLYVNKNNDNNDDSNNDKKSNDKGSKNKKNSNKNNNKNKNSNNNNTNDNRNTKNSNNDNNNTNDNNTNVLLKWPLYPEYLRKKVFSAISDINKIM